MSLIPGNNITLLAADLIVITSNLILRTISAASTDTFDSATNFVQNYIGVLDPVFNGHSFKFTIYNTSTEFSITLNMGEDMLINPIYSALSVDTIPPDSSRTYNFIQTDAVMGESATLAVYPS